MFAQFLERKPRGVFALAAMRAVVVRVIDVRQGCGLELGVFHALKLAPTGCGLLLYNSYSEDTNHLLYKADADAATAVRMAGPDEGIPARRRNLEEMFATAQTLPPYVVHAVASGAAVLPILEVRDEFE